MEFHTFHLQPNVGDTESDVKGVQMNILDLPLEIIQDIFSYLSFHTVSEIRLVCHTFNNTCRTQLNQGFNSVHKRHADIQRRVKIQLPRRESDRRKHSLARHVDILSAVETRLSLLSMTYMKYIDNNITCFIPGKVLDELMRILCVVAHFNDTPRAHEFLQELRDISSMAMEHFEDKIAPSLKQVLPGISSPSLAVADVYSSPSPSPTSVEMYMSPPMSRYSALGADVTRLQQQASVQNNCIQMCKRAIGQLRAKLLNQAKRLSEQDKSLADQRKMISEQKTVIDEHATKTGELATRMGLLETRLCLQPGGDGPQTCAGDASLVVHQDLSTDCHVARRSARISGQGQKRGVSDSGVVSERCKRRKK